MTKLEKILLGTILIVISIIIIVTAISFVEGNTHMGKNLRKIETTPDIIKETTNNDTAYYTKIGKLRCKTKDTNQITLVVEPLFEYSVEDVPFYQEIFRKNQKLIVVVKNYFENFTKKELLDKGETIIKSDLTELINSELVLGKIEKLYLTEYIFLE